MANSIKYSTTGDTESLKKGNIYFGIGDVGKGPSSATTYYNGVSPASSGYTVYSYNASQTSKLSYNSSTNDAQLITYTNGVSGQNFTGATQCLNWYLDQSNYACVNIDYQGIVTSGLTYCSDAGFTPSYTSSGVTWYDISYSGYNGTLTNGPTYSSSNGGSIVFDGVDDYVDTIGSTSSFDFIGSTGIFSIGFWFKMNATNTRTLFIGNTLSNTEKGWLIGVEYGATGYGNNCIRFQATGNATNTRLIAGSTNDNTINATTWTHCLFTSTNGNYVGQWYINGVASTTTTRVGTGNANQGSYYGGPAARTLNVGRCNHSSTLIPLAGNVASVFIYNRTLSASEVLQNYNAQASRFPPSLAGSLVFNGSNQSLGLSPGITFGSGSFTVEGWFFNNSSFVTKGILGSPVTNPTGCMNLFFTSSTVITSDKNGGGGQFNYTMGSAISLNAWHYFIYNRNSNGVTAVYIDGVRCTATATDTLNYTTATNTFARHYGGYFPGYWTNMRITIGTAVYDSSLTTQTNPTSPLSSLANTKYLMLGAAVTTDTSGVQTVTNNNTVTQSSVLKPF